MPAAIVEAAGLEKPWRTLLDRTFSKPGAPEPPSRVAAFAGNGYALVTWCPPVYEGGAPVLAYTVTATGGARVTVSSADFQANSYVKVPGIANGAATTFTVTAKNAHGESSPSLPSRSVTGDERPIPRPAPPARVSALAGANGLVSIHFQDPAAVDKKAPGAPVLAYAVTVNPGGRKVTFTGRRVLALEGTTHTTFSVVDGLEPGQTYTFSVAAVNPTGEGEAAVTRPVTIPGR